MEVEFSLTKQDLAAFFRHHLRCSNPGRYLGGCLSPLGILFLVGFSVLFLNLDLKHPFVTKQIIFGFMMVLPLPLAYLFRHRLSSLRGRFVLRLGGNRKLLEPQRMRIDAEMVTLSTAWSSASVKWSAIERIDVTENHAFIYVSTQQAYILPKHAFGDDVEFTRFVETAQGYFRAANSQGSNFREVAK
ncbi:MAG TPA: YcxB family protein [Gemmataceae bacterium]|nr:YcxB family protein [Gemmataceae bacterium]